MFGGVNICPIINNDEVEKLEQLLNSGVFTVHSLCKSWTPLFYSIGPKSIRCFELLLKKRIQYKSCE